MLTSLLIIAHCSLPHHHATFQVCFRDKNSTRSILCMRKSFFLEIFSRFLIRRQQRDFIANSPSLMQGEWIYELTKGLRIEGAWTCHMNYCFIFLYSIPTPFFCIEICIWWTLSIIIVIFWVLCNLNTKDSKEIITFRLRPFISLCSYCV